MVNRILRYAYIYICYIIATCPYSWLQYDKQCYRLSSDGISHASVETECGRFLGSHPIIINDPVTDAIINAMTSDGEEVWIGLKYNHQSTSYIWYGNTTSLNYTAWGPGQPYPYGHECVTFKKLNVTHGYWYSRSCSNTYHAVCQRGHLTYK